MVLKDKHSLTINYVQLFLFVVIIYLTQHKLFILSFALLLAMIIYMTIAGIHNRVFLWVMAAYTFGYIFLLYGDRLIEEFTLGRSSIIIINRTLLLFPLLFMVYVIRKFKKNCFLYGLRPNWMASITFPFIWSGFHTVTVRTFLIIAIGINLASFIPFISFAKINFGDPNFFLFIILFSVLNGTLEEILWRGIVLTRLVDLAGEKAAVIFSGLGFGLSHLAFGYSWWLCLLYALGGIFYAGITIRSGSILPAIIWHMVFNILMILSGIITYIG
ncbi:CPBP family intramembrane glutamic endopeptidase [Bacillus sp. DTU_2020_1000418_1_SI_GHA_SEK_038]|uniref:CPBP family intramembrane glutamic endopeptidase n=1 Tax=Bacillus sp. DTU_2020_1000418_1_SI_GHA_SEK_038 TaxID=3077585 RepID=UPI0028E91CE7|nr:CPBP family intramembrane glutamic endopeptidase [Bacillus sp. DTU_2020_1000418_1_SI_GHA_SEK_038]WNS77382.1 CPBP family intramembrane glutamic endopeptidase [Bacillus sp. DTU_2020_1000418_1_SI_GHA_SEK_038]